MVKKSLHLETVNQSENTTAMSCEGVKKELENSLSDLSREARDLYLDKEVPVLTEVPTPITFHRKYVAPNKPVVIQGALDHWPALRRWDTGYLREKIGDLEVTVTVTPNGYADAVTDGKFVMPEERRMLFGTFLDIVEGEIPANGTFYIQKQNSNLTDEFASLLADAEQDLDWGNEAFGELSHAVNFWMGESKAITSMHRDHYENLYCVVRGWKRFILLPPTDLPFVPYESYQAASFKESKDGDFDIIDNDVVGQVPWIAIDPLKPDLSKYPWYSKASPISVTVRQGETLYLPSLWFHHVEQSHGCIAVNYWYDMEYDIKYNYYKLVERISKLTR
ncbi:hypothetical protein ScPMuIL_016713 [Solemya velum]